MTAIIDYGLGNLGSIYNMLDVIGEDSVITSNQNEIHEADRIILPGVGAFDTAMKNLKELNLIEVLNSEVKIGKPILGICLGMQLLGRGSEEGVLKGLSYIPFECKKFEFDKEYNLRVPHMGWDVVDFKQNNRILAGIGGVQRYYFVHSYYAKCDFSENVLMTCDYGINFVASVVKDNIYGFQFHPEKSHDFGMRLFSNFVEQC